MEDIERKRDADQTGKTQDIFSRHHLRIILITVGFCILATIGLYAAGFIPSPLGRQSTECEGAQQALATLQDPKDRDVIDEDKIRDARQLAERECAKAS